MSGKPRDPYQDEDLMTVTQAAKFLRVRPAELMTAVNAGEVPHYRLLGRLWFSRSQLFEQLRHIGQPASQPEQDE